MPKTIPLLDISECGLLVGDESSISEETFASFGKRLYEVLSSPGFAYLANHGIPRKKIDAAREISERFFSLPEEEKRELYTHSLQYAYDPLYCTNVDLKHADYYEGIRMTGFAFDDVETQWPNIPKFREISFDLAESLKFLTFRLLRALGSGMQLKDKDYFWKAHSLANKQGNFSTFKYMHYPPVLTRDLLSEGTERIGKHSDKTSLTLLLQDTNGGLQAETEAGIFEDVPPITGTIVLNVGDIMQKWSGGRLKSTVHRVLAPKDPEKRLKSRRSIAYFAIADKDVLMEPLQFIDGSGDGGVVNDGKPITAGQFWQKSFDEHFSAKV